MLGLRDHLHTKPAAGHPLRHGHLQVGDEVEKQALLRSQPEVFFPISTYDWPLVMVRLEAITGLCK